MKMLMRADTHYSIVVGGSECEKPKYTFSQVGAFINHLIIANNKLCKSLPLLDK